MRPQLKILSRPFLLPLVIAISACAAAGAERGDVFVATSNGQVLRFNKSLKWLETLNTGVTNDIGGMSFDINGNLYVTNFNAGNITKFNAYGEIGGRNPFVITESNNESIVFDLNGDFYVGIASPRYKAIDVNIPAHIFKFNSAGFLLDLFEVKRENRGADWIDLAADQRTMFYTSEGRKIFRFDVTTKNQLPNFADLSNHAGIACALRLLPDGGLLVADYVNIKRLSAQGEVVQMYDLPGQDGWFALNLDPDGTSFWSGDQTNNGTLAKFNINNGDVLETANDVSNKIGGLTVYGELTAALPVPSPNTTPLTTSAKDKDWMEELMDTTRLLATYALLAFLVERLTNGLSILLSYWPWWRLRFDTSTVVDSARRTEVERNRRVVLFFMGAFIGIVGALIANLNLLSQAGLQGIPPFVDQVFTGLLIASGGDPIREAIHKRSDRHDEPRPVTPIQVTGTLVLHQPDSDPGNKITTE